MEKKDRLPLRSETNPADCWKIEDLYANDELWEQEYQKLNERMQDFQKWQGKLGDSADHLYQALQEKDEISKLLENVYVYAGQKNHEDTGNGTYQQMNGKAQMLMAQLSDALSFVEPELLEIPEERLEQFLAEKEELRLYERYIREQLRAKEHILSKELEGILAKVSELAQGPQNIFSMFNNADLDFGTIPNEDGEETALTHGRYIQFMESSNREVRKAAFTRLYSMYTQYKNTLGATFAANVQQELFFAKMRKFNSSREMELEGSHIPVRVYDNLIKAVHENLPSMYRYVELRKKMLGVDELHMYDLYVPLVKNVKKEYTFEQAKDIVKNGLAPLGEDYQALLQKGFDEGWIDVYENQGKRSGAYSWGAYGTHPYVLLNYNGSLNHVFTLAHEMGHALHSYYSDKTQSYPYAGYRIFVAEVASTCNEALLIYYLLGQVEDKDERAYLVNYFLEQFKSTLYRQTMFAEFEMLVHEKQQQGESLTAESISKLYYDLNCLYFGEGMVIDEEIAMEWARIPHFYTPFYVYQYATGFSAAIAISNKILSGEEGIVEKYKQFLSGGSSMDCIDLLKICGVDMTSTDPVDNALKVFAEYLDEMEKLYV